MRRTFEINTMLLAVPILMLSGCAGMAVRDKAQVVEGVAVEKVNGQRAFIQDAKVMRDKEGLRAEGRVTSNYHHGRFREHGHIDMTVISRDGNKTMQLVRLSESRIPPTPNGSRFSARLPDLDDGSKVVLRFHSEVITIGTTPHSFD